MTREDQTQKIDGAVDKATRNSKEQLRFNRGETGMGLLNLIIHPCSNINRTNIYK